MVKKHDDLAKLRNNKKGTRFNDLERILKQHGWQLQSITGSHHIYSKNDCLPIMIVKPHGNKKYCHPMDVNKVVNALEAEDQNQGKKGKKDE